jgi:hypothetical protein
MTHQLNQIPTFVLDNVGRKVEPGDTIVYAVRVGNSAEMSSAVVEGFQYPKDRSSAYSANILKLKIRTGTDRFGEPQYSLIHEANKRFAKIDPLS